MLEVDGESLVASNNNLSEVDDHLTSCLPGTAVGDRYLSIVVQVKDNRPSSGPHHRPVGKPDDVQKYVFIFYIFKTQKGLNKNIFVTV